MLVKWHHHVLRDLQANDQKLTTMTPSTMKVKVVVLPDGKHPVRTGEILDQTTVDPEQETAGVQKALIAIQAREPGVRYIPLVPVAIQTPALIVEYIQLALQSATQGQKCTRTSRSPRQKSLVSHTTTYPAEEVDALDSHAQGSTCRTRTRWRSRCVKGVCCEATSVEGGHDIQVTMSARVQPSRGTDHAAPHIIVYGIMVFRPMTPSLDKLHMTSR